MELSPSSRPSPLAPPSTAQSALKPPLSPQKPLGPVISGLTGVRAYADERMKSAKGAANVLNPTSPVSPKSPNTSTNPSTLALDALRHGGGISRPSEGPTALSQQLSTSRPPTLVHDSVENGFPFSIPGFVHKPSPLGAPSSDVKERLQSERKHTASTPGASRPSALSFSSTPGEIRRDSITTPRDSSSTAQSPEGSSFPPFGTPQTPATPAPRPSVRHRCPHCDQSFTRQHNLKSHLLTHSQERPFSCSVSGCSQKFRRMHDKKRHEKLHTGERSYQCKVCNRTFARGDALNRHQKGPSGCVGRVASTSSTGERLDDAMEGVVSTEDGRPSRKRPRQLSLPSMGGNDGSQSQIQGSQDTGYSQPQGSTYPPVGQFRNQQPTEPYFNNTFASQSPFEHRIPPPSQPPTPSFPPPSISLPSTQPVSMLGQSAITESPAPLTPGSGPTQPPDSRKDSMVTQLQKTQLNSRRSTLQSPQPYGPMAPPMKSPVHHPTLPSIHSLPPPPHTLPSQQGNPSVLANFGGPGSQAVGGSSIFQPSNMHTSGLPPGSIPISSQGHGSRQNTDPTAVSNLLGLDVQALYRLLKDLELEVGDLRRRVISLEHQLAAGNGSGSSKGQPHSGQP